MSVQSTCAKNVCPTIDALTVLPGTPVSLKPSLHIEYKDINNIRRRVIRVKPKVKDNRLYINIKDLSMKELVTKISYLLINYLSNARIILSFTLPVILAI